MKRYLSPEKRRELSSVLAMAGYTAMVVTGDVMFGVWTRLIAESLRIAYFRKAKTNDMVSLSAFFIIASLIVICKEYF